MLCDIQEHRRRRRGVSLTQGQRALISLFLHAGLRQRADLVGFPADQRQIFWNRTAAVRV